jgi:hypothetical protein
MPISPHRALAALLTVWFLAGSEAAAADRHFHGPYVGAEVGRQQIIAGSLVNGVDFLTADSRIVGDFFGGLRGQLPVGLVVGAELAYGVFDGSLAFSDPASSLAIAYDGGDQLTYGGTIGWAVGRERDLLVFSYVKETKRSFDVAVSTATSSFAQIDKQGMLRYGAGVEWRATGKLHLRASLGTGRADFGDQMTNVDPGSKVEGAIGVIVQF